MLLAARAHSIPPPPVTSLLCTPSSSVHLSPQVQQWGIVHQEVYRLLDLHKIQLGLKSPFASRFPSTLL